MVAAMKLLFALACIGLAASPALAQPSATLCPALDGPPKVYAIGSSTMATLLGPMLKRVLAADDVEVVRWGRASSGLARPDFHDWPRKVPGLMRRHRPDIVVVSLGSNDFQAIWHNKRWVRFEDERWEKIYAERVDRMLTGAAGEDRERLVIWVGPYAFAGGRAQVRAPIVNRIMRERVEAFAEAGGKVFFVDAFAATTNERGRPLAEARLGDARRAVGIRTSDGIHLTNAAVQAFMGEPIIEVVRSCLAPGPEVAGADGEGSPAELSEAPDEADEVDEAEADDADELDDPAGDESGLGG